MLALAPFIEGGSLQDRLDRQGALAIPEVVQIGIQTASALAAAHSRGLIHRDIKPANLLLEARGEGRGARRETEKDSLAPRPSPLAPHVRVTDFGLARAVDDLRLTQSGVVVGTPQYMAPEQARGETVDSRADLFSLGSVLYALCTGSPPFDGTTMDVLRRVCEDTPIPLRRRNPAVPVWLETFIARLLAKAPADRFQNAAEVAALLEGFLAHLREPGTIPAPSLAVGVRPGPPRGRRGRWLPVLLVLGVLGLFAPRLFWGGGAEQPAAPAEFYQDFRGGNPPRDPLVIYGDGAPGVVQPEERGLRITVPVNPWQIHRIGLLAPVSLRGDFEVTAGYEILKVDPPREGHGVGVMLQVETQAETEEVAELLRALRIQEGDTYGCTHIRLADGRRQYFSDWVPTTCRAGALRITRAGTEAMLSASEGDSDRFVELRRIQLGSDDVKVIRFAASMGHAPNALDVLLKDLRIRSLTPVEAAGNVGPVPGVGRPARTKRWLLAAMLVGAGTLLTALWVWVRARRKRRLPHVHGIVRHP